MYTVEQFRSLIRDTLLLDSTDLPNGILDEWIRDGATRAQTRRQQWPFFEKNWSFTTQANKSIYTLAEAKGVSTYDIAEIRQVRGPSWELRWQDITTRDRLRSKDSNSAGSPKYWSQWSNGDLILDPTPVAAETFDIRGYQLPKDWVAANETSDMPKEFDTVILNWAIGRAYAQQDEPQMAVYYADLSDLRLRELTKYFDDPSPAHNVTMGGDYKRSMTPLMDPRFSWE